MLGLPLLVLHFNHFLSGVHFFLHFIFILMVVFFPFINAFYISMSSSLFEDILFSGSVIIVRASAFWGRILISENALVHVFCFPLTVALYGISFISIPEHFMATVLSSRVSASAD